MGKTLKTIFSALLSTIAMLTAIGCAEKRNAQESIFPSDCLLQTGDIVFRRGSGLTSRAVIIADKGGVYSHVGIVVETDSGLMIAHAVPGEYDFEGDNDRVKLDKPKKFFSNVNAVCGEVCRHNDSKAAEKAAKIALSIYERNTPFDHNYDETDTTKMYCTQLITHSFEKAGKPFVNIKHDDIDFLMLHTRCILPSALLESEQLRSIYKF